MAKRIKSFFISLGSLAASSFIALIFTPQWADFTAWVGTTGHNLLLGWGVPAAAIIVIGMFFNEIWRGLINKYIARKEGVSSIAGASRAGADTY